MKYIWLSDHPPQIDLPPYKDYTTLEQKLTLAVEETVGFGYVLIPITVVLHIDYTILLADKNSYVPTLSSRTLVFVFRIRFSTCNPTDCVMPNHRAVCAYDICGSVE